MRLIDADAFEVVTAKGVSMDFADGMQYVLEMIDKAPTIEADICRRVARDMLMEYKRIFESEVEK